MMSNGSGDNIEDRFARVAGPPMTSDLDIYRSANELIKQHGDVADIEAATLSN